MAYFLVRQLTQALPPNTGVHLVIPGDWDHDGDIDFIQAFAKSPPEDTAIPIQLLVNDGSGTFTAGTAAYFGVNVPTTVHPRTAVVADLNGDGFSDLFIGDHGMDAGTFPGAQNRLLLSNPTGLLVDATATLPQLHDFTHSVSGGDIDGDGDTDLLVMNTAGGTPSQGALTAPYFLLNDGKGHFTRSDDLLPPHVEARSFGDKYTTTLFFDADNDGDLDLFLGTHGETVGEQSRILLNPGNGNFSTATGWLLPSAPWGAVPNQIAVASVSADFNGDGRIDLLVTITRNYMNPYLQILINNGDGTFVDESATRLPPQDLNRDGWIVGTQLVDINGDGFVDILAENNARSPLFINDGTGHFYQLPANMLSYPGWDFPEVVNHYAADLNGDGRMDLLGHSLGNLIWTFIQQDQGLLIDGTADADGLLGDGDAETFHGGGGDDVVFGGAGNDLIYGEAGDDKLFGGAGNDSLDGGVGNDTVRGGAGDDSFVIGETLDQVIENPGEGYDTVVTTLAAYALTANVEALRAAAGSTTGHALTAIISTTSSLAGTATTFSTAGPGTTR